MFNFQKGVFHPFSFKTLLISAAFLLLLITAFTLPAAVMVSTTQGSRELPIYCVQTDQKKIALTFDAAWGNEDTADLLSILARNQIHATFFLTGSWVDTYPDDVKAIAAAGHDIGNHSQTHPGTQKCKGADWSKYVLFQTTLRRLQQSFNTNSNRMWIS